jgi:hypothetical protein
MKLELNKWYYKFYEGNYTRKILIYLNKYNSDDDSYVGRRICKVKYADSTTITTIDDDYHLWSYELENVEPCDNPMDIFEEIVNRYFIDWFGV